MKSRVYVVLDHLQLYPHSTETVCDDDLCIIHYKIIIK